MRSATKYSEELKQDVTMTEIAKGCWTVKTADGTLYTQSELDALKQQGLKTPVQVHILKKVFKGTVVKSGKG